MGGEVAWWGVRLLGGGEGAWWEGVRMLGGR